ncbi:MAG: MAPEG family protein [Steroidobacteraceae bacterium]
MNALSPTAMLMPMAAMVALTAIVWVRLYFERIGEMRERRIRPQAVATSREMAAALTRTQAADNLRNLFEIPVLFYALCLAVTSVGGATPLLVDGAWAYVVLRAAHSLIHCSYNRVMHRFATYVASTALLFVLWAAFVARMV